MARLPEIGPDERAAIALALGKARKRRHPDVVTVTIPPKYGCVIAFEQKEFGLARHLIVKALPGRKQAEAVIAIAEAFGFTPPNTLSQWVDEEGDFHILGTDHDFHA